MPNPREQFLPVADAITKRMYEQQEAIKFMAAGLVAISNGTAKEPKRYAKQILLGARILAPPSPK